jgi:hypothetical protein
MGQPDAARDLIKEILGMNLFHELPVDRLRTPSSQAVEEFERGDFPLQGQRGASG